MGDQTGTQSLIPAEKGVYVACRIRRGSHLTRDQSTCTTVVVPGEQGIIQVDRRTEGPTSRASSEDASSSSSSSSTWCHSFSFDQVWTEADPNETLWSQLKDRVLMPLQGYNSTIFAYGQTGSGKST